MTLIARDLTGEWVLIRTADGTTGWLHRDQLRANVDIVAVAVAGSLPPTPSANVISVHSEGTASADGAAQTDLTIIATASVSDSCDPSYPTICVAPAPPVLSCEDIAYRNFTVIQPDPHGFDADDDGVGCEGSD